MEKNYVRKNDYYRRPKKNNIIENRLIKKIKKMTKISKEEANYNYHTKKLEICTNLQKYLDRFDEQMTINEENIIYLMKKLDDQDYNNEDDNNLSEKQQVRFKDFFLSLMKKEVSVDFDNSESDDFEGEFFGGGNKKIRNLRNFDF